MTLRLVWTDTDRQRRLDRPLSGLDDQAAFPLPTWASTDGGSVEGGWQFPRDISHLASMARYMPHEILGAHAPPSSNESLMPLEHLAAWDIGNDHPEVWLDLTVALVTLAREMCELGCTGTLHLESG